MNDDLKTAIAEEVKKQLAAADDYPTVLKVLNALNQKLGTGNKAEIINWVMPNYAAGNKQKIRKFVAPSAGLVIVDFEYSDASAVAKVNGYVFCRHYGGGEDVGGQSSAGSVLVSEGDVIEFAGAPSTSSTITFFPLKGI